MPSQIDTDWLTDRIAELAAMTRHLKERSLDFQPTFKAECAAFFGVPYEAVNRSYDEWGCIAALWRHYQYGDPIHPDNERLMQDVYPHLKDEFPNPLISEA